MKAGMNGVPNLIVVDGWWVEGYTGSNGWLIDGGSAIDDHAKPQHAADAAALYRLLEEEIVPTFYTRDDRGLPPPAGFESSRRPSGPLRHGSCTPHGGQGADVRHSRAPDGRAVVRPPRHQRPGSLAGRRPSSLRFDHAP